jgi:hypothetical protein
VTDPGRITLVDRAGRTTVIDGDLIGPAAARPILDRNSTIDRIEIDIAVP